LERLFSVFIIEKEANLSYNIFIIQNDEVTMMKIPNTVRLKTPFEQNPNNWDIYPRPQMVRDSFFPIGGDWKLYAVNQGGKTSLGTI
jgi:hypothetical protein